VEHSGEWGAFKEAFVMSCGKTFKPSNLTTYPRSGWYHRYNGLSSPFKP